MARKVGKMSGFSCWFQALFEEFLKKCSKPPPRDVFFQLKSSAACVFFSKIKLNQAE